MFVVLELNRRALQDAPPFDIDPVVIVDKNVGDRRVLQERLERAETENFVKNFLNDAVALDRKSVV